MKIYKALLAYAKITISFHMDSKSEELISLISISRRKKISNGPRVY